MTDPTVLERVARLLALSDGTSNPNEAAVAAAQAQRLMTRHRLSRADVVERRDEIRAHGDRPLFVGKRLRSWLLALAQAVTRNNGCFSVLVRDSSGRKSLVVVGRIEDVDLVRYVFTYVRREIDRVTKHYRRAGVFWERGSETRFRLGAVTAVSMAMAKARNETLQGASETAIVRVKRDEKEAEQWAYENIDGLEESATRRVEVSVWDASFAAGLNEGKKISLRRGIQNGKEKGRLG